MEQIIIHTIETSISVFIAYWIAKVLVPLED